jgi:phosphoenolpyruvate synthase/pyruvate phosphate dikinase
MIIPLHSDNVPLGLGGGKGASLARLIRDGFPVPGGFLITTHAYHLYVVTNNKRLDSTNR